MLVLVELKVRFDEENNIEWSRRLEAAGCTVIYGLNGFKVHSKLCLITKNRNGNPEYYTQIGTGNYNEKTSRIYTDLSLMTADNVQARELQRDGNYFRVENDREPMNSQEYFYDLAYEQAKITEDASISGN